MISMFTFTGEPGTRMTRWTCRECGESGFMGPLATGRPWDIEAHRCRETWSDRVNYLWAREHLEALAWAQDAQEEQVRLAVIGDPGRACGCPPEECLGHQDPVVSILAALSEPLGLPGASLPAYGVPGDGCCRECLRPPVHSQGLCVYCGALEPVVIGDLRQAGTVRTVTRVLQYVTAVCLVAYGLVALLWAAGVIR